MTLDKHDGQGMRLDFSSCKLHAVYFVMNVKLLACLTVNNSKYCVLCITNIMQCLQCYCSIQAVRTDGSMHPTFHGACAAVVFLSMKQSRHCLYFLTPCSFHSAAMSW